jgi:GntR family transcriptional regulator
MKHKIFPDLGEIRRRAGISCYHQLYQLLDAALHDGTIPAGAALPSETELMLRFQISRNTARRALGRLADEKRIVRRRGSGSYARLTPGSDFQAHPIVDVIHDLGAARAHTVSRLLRVTMTTTPEFIRRKDPSFGATSLVVQRTRSFKRVSFMLSTSYVPEEVAKTLTRRQLARQVVLLALIDSGARPSIAEQNTTAITADAMAASHLGVEPASALLCVHRLIRDHEGRSLEHQSHVFRPDRCQFRARTVLERTPGGLAWSGEQAMPVPATL